MSLEIAVNGRILATDAHGFLRRREDWNVEVAAFLAVQEGIQLSEDHWQVIHYVRDYYSAYETSPHIRPLVKFLAERWGKEKGNSLYLHTLFREPSKQACKIAGLPKPARCL